MTTTPPNGTEKRPASADVPSHVAHPSFELPGAEREYDPAGVVGDEFAQTHLPDDVTRDCARRMHYAAWRLAASKDARRRQRWRAAYFALRDHIVLGNRKLIYRAVRRWMPPSAWADDMAGDCHIVLIQAVAAYNPWMGIRFSTYAFTCLMRALSRLSQRHASDRLARSLPLDSLPGGEPYEPSLEASGPGALRIDVFLQESHELLSPREKQVIQRRFRLDERERAGTLEQVGRELGLSKERVRQVQAAALGKLRKALVEEPPAS